MESKKILIAPLDWGLGHTTRCIPIIRYLLNLGHQVLVATEGMSEQIIKENFPQIQILPLKGYNILYAKNKAGFRSKLLSQIPKILKRIQSEHQWLDSKIDTYKIDAVISDNRYGLHSSKVPCAIMTHQVQILSGMGAFADKTLLKWHRKLLEKFNQTWIVDIATNPGLASILSHPKRLPNNAQYIGWLSQFENTIQQGNAFNYDCLIILSGPEPMRGQLEQILLQQCASLSEYKFCFVAGKIMGSRPISLPENIDWKNYLTDKELQAAFENSKSVICRSGYSTLMDLKVFGRPALLIPTPGQSEQEYLARQSHPNEFMYCEQEKIDLAKLLPQLLNLKSANSEGVNTDFIKILNNWLNLYRM